MCQNTVRSYEYLPLEKHFIRVVSIQPGGFNARIRLEISHISLIANSAEEGSNSQELLQVGEDTVEPPLTEKLLDFEALSYHWGNEGANVSILLNDCDFKVSPSLESIFRYLRAVDMVRSIWVDAICIDQKNPDEKKSQIPDMHVIYAQARRVIVWLGDPSADSHLAMRYVRDVHAPVEPGKEDQICDDVAHTEWPLSYLATAPLSQMDLECLTGFYKLLRRPWWYRAWIVQEMSLAREMVVQCGSETVSFSQMKVALQINRRIHPAFILYADVVSKVKAESTTLKDDWTADAINNALNLEYCRRVILKRRSGRGYGDGSSAMDVSWSLWSTRARGCQKKHDRTFSVLGIAGKAFRDRVEYSYEKVIEEHNRDTVRWFIAATNSLDIILHSQHSKWLPQSSSWAPDWDRPERAGVFHLNKQSLKKPINLTLGDVYTPEGTSKLRVKGRVLGEISATMLEVDRLVPRDFHINAKTMPVTALADPNTLVSERRRWWVFKPEYETGGMFRDALDRLPASDNLWTMHLELFLTEFAALFGGEDTSYLVPTQFRGLNSNMPVITDEQRFRDFEQFWELLEYLLMSRTICKMADARLMVAPDFACVGDVVAVVAGCSNPVVLRRHRNDGSFTFLGDAHVLGVREAETSRERLDWFEIH